MQKTKEFSKKHMSRNKKKRRKTEWDTTAKERGRYGERDRERERDREKQMRREMARKNKFNGNKRKTANVTSGEVEKEKKNFFDGGKREKERDRK